MIGEPFKPHKRYSILTSSMTQTLRHVKHFKSDYSVYTECNPTKLAQGYIATPNDPILAPGGRKGCASRMAGPRGAHG